MKTKSLLFATLCSAMLFSACNQEELVETNPGSNGMFTVNLKGDFNLVPTRVVTPEGSEALIEDTWIFLYNGSGDLIGKHKATSLNNSTVNIPIQGQGQVTDVYTLSNVGTSSPFTLDGIDLDSDQSGNPTKATLDEAALKAASVASHISPKHLPFVGKTATISNDNKADVTLGRKVSRISVTNETGQPITVGYKNLAEKYVNVMGGNPNVTPNSTFLEVSPSEVSPNDKNTIYALPNADPDNLLIITVDGKEFPASVLEANKVYNFTVRKDNSIEVTLTLTENWESESDQDIQIGSTPSVNVATASGQYSSLVELAGLTDATGLSAVSTNFDVTFAATTRASGKVTATVKAKRPFDETSEVITVMKDGQEVFQISAQNTGFEYEEISAPGGLKIMDRSLGAKNANLPGELFMPGKLIPLDQAEAPEASFKHKAEYSGNGRLSLAEYSSHTFNRNDLNDPSKDPCPAGWHTMSKDEATLLFGSTNIAGQNAQAPNGTINYGTDANQGIVTYNFSQPGSTPLVWNAQSGYAQGNTFFNNTNGRWPTAWFISGELVNNKYAVLAFNVSDQTGSNGPNFSAQVNNNFGDKRALQIRCVKNRD